MARPRLPRTYKKCLRCQKTFTGYPCYLKKQKYCSIRCSKIGHPQWNTGKTHFKKGYKHSPNWYKTMSNFIPWNKGKSFLAVKGEKNGNWKGGITPINKALRETFEYEEWRTKVFERDLYTCQGCGKIGGWLEADHIKPFALYPELRLEISNGRTLCKPCHKKLGWELFRENNPMKGMVVYGN